MLDSLSPSLSDSLPWTIPLSVTVIVAVVDWSPVEAVKIAVPAVAPAE